MRPVAYFRHHITCNDWKTVVAIREFCQIHDLTMVIINSIFSYKLFIGCTDEQAEKIDEIIVTTLH